MAAEDYMNSVSIQAQCVRCEYTWDSACPEAVEWEYAQVRILREQGLREPEWQPMKAGTGQVLQRYQRAPYSDPRSVTITLDLSTMDQATVNEICRMIRER